MRTVIACLLGGVLAVGIVACKSATSSSSSSGSSSGGSSGNATATNANEVPPDCLQRCEAAAAKCGGADEAFCADACKSYTQAQLLCMEKAGCDSAAIAACTSSGSDDDDDDGTTASSSSGTTSSSSSGGTTTTVSCTTGPVEKQSGDKCAASCITIAINGSDYCAKSCGDDGDCSSTTRCTVNGSKFCARTCSTHTTCKSYGFTTCATGYTEDPTESVCAY